jgi:hypothetical protein
MGVLIFHRKAPGKIEILTIESLARFYKEADRQWPNSGEGAHRSEGKVGEKVQELTSVTGVAGVEEERGWNGESTANRGGQRGSEGWRQRSGGRSAWQGLRGGGASGRRRDRAAVELELTGAVVRAARVRKSKIGQVCEPQWVAAVLLEHWIAGGKRWRRLMTAGRSCGGAPVRSSAREEGRQWKCESVKARVSSLGAQGCAWSWGGGTVTP